MQTLTHKGTQTIETNRTIMRKFRLDDAEAMYKNWASDSEVTRFLTWKAHSTLKVSQDVIDTWCGHYNDNTYHWALTLKGCDEPIGSIGIVRLNEEKCHGEFGYAISRKEWGKGIVTEAMTALLEYFFNEIGFETIDGLHDINNPASGKVMQKLGMKYVDRIDGQFKDNVGNPTDVFHYTIDKKSFNTIKIRQAYAYEVELVGQLYDNLVGYMDKTVNYPGWKIGIYPTIEEAASGYSEDSLYVAVIGGKIAGTCMLNNVQPEEYNSADLQVKCDNPLVVHTLAVNPEFMGTGVAMKLLDFAFELAKSQGTAAIRLDTSEKNTPAIKLYIKAGFAKVGCINLGLERGGITNWYVFEKLVK